MVLEDANERRMCFQEGICYYSDVSLGLFVVRGDSMVLLGQVSDFMLENKMKEVALEELMSKITESGTGVLNWDFDADLEA